MKSMIYNFNELLREIELLEHYYEDTEKHTLHSWGRMISKELTDMQKRNNIVEHGKGDMREAAQ